MVPFSKWKVFQKAGPLFDTSRLESGSNLGAKILQNRLPWVVWPALPLCFLDLIYTKIDKYNILTVHLLVMLQIQYNNTASTCRRRAWKSGTGSVWELPTSQTQRCCHGQCKYIQNYNASHILSFITRFPMSGKIKFFPSQGILKTAIENENNNLNSLGKVKKFCETNIFL